MVDGQPRLDETEMTDGAMNSVDLYYAMMGPSIIESGQNTFALPGVEGRWAFIADGSYFAHGILLSPTAVWIFNPGEVIRVDRKAVEALRTQGRPSGRRQNRKTRSTPRRRRYGRLLDQASQRHRRHPSHAVRTTWPKKVVVRL